MKKAIITLVVAFIFCCVSVSKAEIVSVPLPQFSGVTSANKEFDLGVTFIEINSVKLIVSGHATPGRSYDSYQDWQSGGPYDVLPAKVSAEMPYPFENSFGSFDADSDEVVGDFTVEITFIKKMAAEWSVLFDGKSEMDLFSVNYFSFGFGEIVQPTITFSEVIMVIDGTVEPASTTVSVPLPQFSGKTDSIYEKIDLGTSFSDISSVKLLVSGNATPGLAYDEGIDWSSSTWGDEQTHPLPAKVLAYMPYDDGFGSFMNTSESVSGDFTVEIELSPSYDALWDVLYDGKHKLSLSVDSYATVAVIGAPEIIYQPSITFSEVTMIVEGIVSSMPQTMDSETKNIYHLVTVSKNWLQEDEIYNLEGDYSLDGKVDIQDFAILAKNWMITEDEGE